MLDIKIENKIMMMIFNFDMILSILIDGFDIDFIFFQRIETTQRIKDFF